MPLPCRAPPILHHGDRLRWVLPRARRDLCQARGLGRVGDVRIPLLGSSSGAQRAWVGRLVVFRPSLPWLPAASCHARALRGLHPASHLRCASYVASPWRRSACCSRVRAGGSIVSLQDFVGLSQPIVKEVDGLQLDGFGDLVELRNLVNLFVLPKSDRSPQRVDLSKLSLCSSSCVVHVRPGRSFLDSG